MMECTMGSFEAKFQARYGRDDLTIPASHNETIAQMLTHRSVRAYLPDAVSSYNFV